MKPFVFMLIACEASGDVLAAELAGALRSEVVRVGSEPTADVQPLRTELEPRFFGAGGPRMASAGVELAFDMTRDSVIGVSGVVKHYFKFRRIFRELLKLAVERQPDAIIGVDSDMFNRPFAHAIKRHARRHFSRFSPWNPRLIQYVSPQVWASRPGRAYEMAAIHDMVVSIFPFEKDWYAKRAPDLRVEFVGHPVADRFKGLPDSVRNGESLPDKPVILLLPGSRPAELRHHLPVMLGALKIIQSRQPNARARLVSPNETLAEQARAICAGSNLDSQVGNLEEALACADIAIASTGTVTMECAWFGVPSVTLYKASPLSYYVAKQFATVKWLSMPNLLANEEVFPEFIQNAATPGNIAGAALDLLNSASRREAIKAKLAQVIGSLGGPGASRRAARAIVSLLE